MQLRLLAAVARAVKEGEMSLAGPTGEKGQGKTMSAGRAANERKKLQNSCPEKLCGVIARLEGAASGRPPARYDIIPRPDPDAPRAAHPGSNVSSACQMGGISSRTGI